MTAQERLKGKPRWLTAPSIYTTLVGAAVAVLAANFTLEIPAGAGGWLLGILVVAAVVLNVIGDVVEQRRLASLTGLAQGHLKATQDVLARAAEETMGAPGFTFMVALVLFTTGAFCSAAAWFALSDVPLALAGRVLLIGVMVAPITAVMAFISLLPRARATVSVLLECGLSPARLRKALPPRFELRRRLMWFSAIVAATPAALAVDVGSSRLKSMLMSLPVGGDGAATMALWDTALSAGLGPLVGLTLVSMALVVGCGLMLGRALGAPVEALALHTARLARGDYSAGTVVVGEFETWAAATSIADMESHLDVAVVQVRETVLGMAAVTAELSDSGRQHQSGAETQSVSLAATTATTEELARSARQIATNAQQVSELARRTLETARDGKASAEEFTDRMREVRTGNQAIADSVVRLNKRVQQVGRIVDFIDGIADKTDLLALNAELEGNKAGEVGRGFSLVAAEMRRLAESVMTNTREIGRLIEEIRDATNAAVMATEAGVKATDAGSAIAERVSVTLTEIVDLANRTSDAMNSISGSTAQQQAGTDQLADAMGDILRTTRDGAEVSKQMSGANESLVTLSKQLAAALTRLGGRA